MNKVNVTLRATIVMALIVGWVGTGEVLFAQQVSGTVTDETNGESLPGVNIAIKGTTTGTSTNSEGDYRLNVESSQDTLLFSFVGYKTREVSINGRTEIDIALQPQAVSGEELVVVGYGTQEEQEVTSSVTSVSAEEFNKGQVNNVAELIQGKVSGLAISRPGDNPNEEYSIRLRGLSTIGANTEPLIVIDSEKDKESRSYIDKNNVAKNMRFLPLKPGAVKPAGWLEDWAQKAANGITGKLDQQATTFKKGWTGESFDAMGAEEEGTRWPLEQSAYWLDGLVRLAYILDDPKLKQKVKSRLDPVVEGVLNGGPSFIYWRSRDQLDREFDNWAHSHMGRAMVAYYMATKDQKILNALVKVYRNYPLPKLTSEFYPVSGAVNVDPMFETYRLSGDTAILDNLQSFAKRKEFNNTVKTWSNSNLVPGHSVVYYEDIRIPSVIYALTGRYEYLQATQTAFNWGDRNHGLPIGLVSGEEFSAGIGSTRNVETCDIAAGSWTINWLLRITGNRKYGDRLEKIFFNAGPAPIDKDFKTVCYYQSPNRLSTEFPAEEPRHPHVEGYSSYEFTKIGHPVLCCVGNSNRIVPNYIMHMWMKPVSEKGVAAMLYGPSEVNTEIDNVPVTIKSQTSYPFEEEITMTVNPQTSLEFKLFIRIPEWSKNPFIAVNGDKIPVEVNQYGYSVVNRIWEEGDKVAVRFPMHVKLLTGKTTNYPEIDYFKKHEKARKLAKTSDIVFPYGNVKYGPLLFALPIPNDGPNRVKTKLPYNFALAMDPQSIENEVEIERTAMPSRWEWTLGKTPLKITVPALQFDWEPKELQPLPDSPIENGKRTKIELVPYGVTKFRMSMFPVGEETWKNF